MLVQFDLALFGSLGLGSFELDLSLQLNAAFQANIALSNPFDALYASLQAALTVQANIQALLSLGLPALNLNLSVNIGINVGLMASLGLKLGGIQLMISAALAVKLPVIDFIAQLALSVGTGVVLASFGFDEAPEDTLAGVGNQLQVAMNAGIGGLNPVAHTYGIILLGQTPSVKGSLSAMFLVA